MARALNSTYSHDPSSSHHPHLPTHPTSQYLSLLNKQPTKSMESHLCGPITLGMRPTLECGWSVAQHEGNCFFPSITNSLLVLGGTLCPISCIFLAVAWLCKLRNPCGFFQVGVLCWALLSPVSCLFLPPACSGCCQVEDWTASKRCAVPIFASLEL